MKSVDVETGREKILAKNTKADIVGGGLTFDPRNDKAQAAVVYFGTMQRTILDHSIAVDFKYLKTVNSGDVSYVGSSQNHQHWLIRYMNGGPFEYYIYNRRLKKATRLFSDLDRLDTYKMAIRKSFIVKSADGLDLPCRLYFPADADRNNDGMPDKPLPTVVYVHGGPWIGFLANSWFSNRNFQLLANRGCAVIDVEFRGTTGYGRKFLDAGNLQWAGRMHRDVIDVLDTAVKRKVAIENRTAIWGWSYGGYTNVCGTDFCTAKICLWNCHVWTFRSGKIFQKTGRR